MYMYKSMSVDKLNDLTLFMFIDIDECASAPCHHNATCVDHVNSFSCVCSPGYTDPLCCTGNSLVWVLQTQIYDALIYVQVVVNASIILVFVMYSFQYTLLNLMLHEDTRTAFKINCICFNYKTSTNVPVTRAWTMEPALTSWMGITACVFPGIPTHNVQRVITTYIYLPLYHIEYMDFGVKWVILIIKHKSNLMVSLLMYQFSFAF